MRAYQKKIASVLLLLVLVISITACDSNGDTESPGGDLTQEQVSAYNLSDIVEPDAQWEEMYHVEDGIFIEGLNFDNNNQLWFLDVAGHRIYTIVDGKVEVAMEDENAMPNGAKFIDEVNLLVVDRLLGIYTFNTQTRQRTMLFSDFNGTPFLGLNDVALDGNGGVYITDAGSASTTNAISKVYYMTLDESPTLTLFESNIAYANGIACSPDGSAVYISEFSRNQLLKAPSTPGRETTRILARLEKGIGPDGVETDSDGNIYAAHLEAGEIVVIAPDGMQYGAIKLPDEAGILVSNLTFHEEYMYACEAMQSIIWRIPLKAAME